MTSQARRLASSIASAVVFSIHYLKDLGILPLPSMYIFALLRFVSQNRDLFVTNSEIHNINTRQHHDLHLPLPNLMKYQTGVFCRGIKLFNGLPDFLKKESFNKKKNSYC